MSLIQFQHEPSDPVAVQSLKLNKPVAIAGFYFPKKTSAKEKEPSGDEADPVSIIDKLTLNNLDTNNNAEISQEQQRENLSAEHDVDQKENEHSAVNVNDENGDDQGEGEEEDAEDDEDEQDGGWITPSNFDKIRRMNQMGDDEKEEIRDTQIKVGCMTSDFSMQVSENYHKTC